MHIIRIFLVEIIHPRENNSSANILVLHCNIWLNKGNKNLVAGHWKVVNVTKSNILNVDNIKCDYMSFILNVLSNSKKQQKLRRCPSGTAYNEVTNSKAKWW